MNPIEYFEAVTKLADAVIYSNTNFVPVHAKSSATHVEESRKIFLLVVTQHFAIARLLVTICHRTDCLNLVVSTKFL